MKTDILGQTVTKWFYDILGKLSIQMQLYRQAAKNRKEKEETCELEDRVTKKVN